MKVAKARYTGRKGEHTKYLPHSEREYEFRARHRANPWTDIDNVEAAEELEETLNYDVEWSARGRLYARGVSVVNDLGYHDKRSLASDLGIEFDEQPDEEELDTEIEDMVEAMEDTQI